MCCYSFYSNEGVIVRLVYRQVGRDHGVVVVHGRGKEAIPIGLDDLGVVVTREGGDTRRTIIPSLPAPIICVFASCTPSSRRI